MKKVNSVSKIKVKNANSKTRPNKLFVGSIKRAKNLMINIKALKEKEGGTTFSDYCLDLMKLR